MNINRRLAEMYNQKVTDTSMEEDAEVNVFTVESYRKPSIIRRVGTMAAAAVVIAGIGGSVFALSGIGNAPETQLTDMSETSEESEEVPEEATEEMPTEAPTEPEFVDNNSYDMSTKEGIYAKMINSFFNYDQISGKIVTNETYKEQVCAVTDFEFDLTTGKAHSYLSRVNYENSFEDIINGAAPIGEEDNWISKGAFFGHLNLYCDGQYEYWLYDDMTYDRAADAEMHPRYGNPIQADIMREFDKHFYESVFEGDGHIVETDIFENTNYGINSHLGSECAVPSMSVMLVKLYDFDAWEIVGDIEYIGRDCVEISMDYNENTVHTKVYIDKETGCLLYALETTYGEVTDYLVTLEINFDEDAEPVPEIDLSEYTMPEPISDEEYDAYKVNSHGETYGIGGGYHICNDNKDLLPDLSSFGDGYERISELFETLNCESRLSDLRQEPWKLDTDVLIYSRNVYDCEGEYIATCNYYGTPEQKAEFDATAMNPCEHCGNAENDAESE